MTFELLPIQAILIWRDNPVIPAAVIIRRQPPVMEGDTSIATMKARKPVVTRVSIEYAPLGCTVVSRDMKQCVGWWENGRWPYQPCVCGSGRGKVGSPVESGEGLGNGTPVTRYVIAVPRAVSPSQPIPWIGSVLSNKATFDRRNQRCIVEIICAADVIVTRNTSTSTVIKGQCW